MRVIRPNNRDTRRSNAAKQRVKEIKGCFGRLQQIPVKSRGKLFCYIEYLEEGFPRIVWNSTYTQYKVVSTKSELHKRMFTSYAAAIGHLTKIKLNLIDPKADTPWNYFLALQVVQGYYDSSGKEVVFRRVRLNERPSSQKPDSSGRFSRKQYDRIRRSLRVPQGVAGTTSSATGTGTVRVSGTIASCGPTTTVVGDYDVFDVSD